MAGYIPRQPGHVITDLLNKIICVVPVYQGVPIPFVIKNGKLTRADVKKKDKIKVEDKKEYGKIVAQVAAIFARNKRLKSVPENSGHILPSARTNQTERERLRVLSKYKSLILRDGRIKIFKTELKRGKKTKTPQIFPDIDTAIRSRDHILENYLSGTSCELAINTQIAEMIAGANLTLLSWNEVDDLAIEKMEKNIQIVTRLLNRARNHFKVTAHSQLEKIPGIKDVLGRINPSAMAARSATAGASIEKRGDEIVGKVAYTVALRAVLSREKMEMDNNLLSVKIKIKALLNSSVKIYDNKPMIEQKLNEIMSLLRGLWLNPYRPNASDAYYLVARAKKNLLFTSLDLTLVCLEGALTILE